MGLGVVHPTLARQHFNSFNHSAYGAPPAAELRGVERWWVNGTVHPDMCMSLRSPCHHRDLHLGFKSLWLEGWYVVVCPGPFVFRPRPLACRPRDDYSYSTRLGVPYSSFSSFYAFTYVELLCLLLGARDSSLARLFGVWSLILSA